MTEAAMPTRSGAASKSGADDSDLRHPRAALDEARAAVGRVDELPLSERGAVLAEVNELLVAELAAMDEA